MKTQVECAELLIFLYEKLGEDSRARAELWLIIGDACEEANLLQDAIQCRAIATSLMGGKTFFPFLENLQTSFLMSMTVSDLRSFIRMKKENQSGPIRMNYYQILLNRKRV